MPAAPASSYEVNVADFGAVGDDRNDDYPAFAAALAKLKTLAGNPVKGNTPPPKLIIPAKRYYLSKTLNIHQPMHILGVGGSPSLEPGSGLRFPPGQKGIVLHEHRTTDDGGGNASADSGLGDAGGSTVEGLVLWGGAAGSFNGPYTNPAANDPTAHGIQIRSVGCSVIDCAVAFFSGSGVWNGCSSGSTGTTAGNGNNFYLERVWCQYNGGDGFTIFGSDSNAGTLNTCSAITNAGAGFKDYSFLGNTHIMPHTRGNGVYDPCGAGNPTGTCVYQGNHYFVVANRGADASTTVPGADSSVWYPWTGFDNTPKTWTPGMKWVSASCYETNPTNVNARTLFLGPYAELGQVPVQATYPTLIVGGSIDDGPGILGTGVWVGAGQSGLTTRRGFTVNSDAGRSITYGGDDANSLYGVFASGHGINRLFAGINYQGGNALQEFADNSKIISQIGWGDDAGRMGPWHHWFNKLHVGPLNSAVRLDAAFSETYDYNGDTVPQGSIFFNKGPGPNSYMGRVCTTPGVIGSDAVFHNLARVGGAGVFSGLPQSPEVGDEAVITDCTTQAWGAVASGGGSLYARLNWNGANWTVIGK